MGEHDSGGGAKKGSENTSSFWSGLRSIGEGLLEGFTGQVSVGGASGRVSRSVDRRDPVADERQAAVRQIHRSLKAWRQRQDDDDESKSVDEAKEPAPEQEQEPAKSPVAEEASSGVALKVFRAKGDEGKKRGDHLFNNGLKKLPAEFTGLMGELPAKGKTAMDAAIAQLSSCVGLPGFEICVNKGATVAGGDDNSKNFGAGLAAFRTACKKFVEAARAVDDAELALETAPDAKTKKTEEENLKKAQAALDAAATAASSAWTSLVSDAYDAGCEPLLSKAQKKDAAAASGALAGVKSAIAAAFGAAATAIKAKGK